ncbi:MAG TPA: hypothetical protein VHJ59_01470 [Nitrososphaera sp.]|nr:hypothetical protein [Nitrososphaera sp.]
MLDNSEAQQNEFKVFVSGSVPGATTVRELDLKAQQIPDKKLIPASGFVVKPESVMQVKQGQNLFVFTSDGVDLVEKVRITDENGIMTNLLPSREREWSLVGITRAFI